MHTKDFPKYNINALLRRLSPDTMSASVHAPSGDTESSFLPVHHVYFVDFHFFFTFVLLSIGKVRNLHQKYFEILSIEKLMVERSIGAIFGI